MPSSRRTWDALLGGSVAGPQGPAGPAGAQGPQGPQGPAGPAGAGASSPAYQDETSTSGPVSVLGGSRIVLVAAEATTRSVSLSSAPGVARVTIACIEGSGTADIEILSAGAPILIYPPIVDTLPLAVGESITLCFEPDTDCYYIEGKYSP